jgi:hypothetical protein
MMNAPQHIAKNLSKDQMPQIPQYVFESSIDEEVFAHHLKREVPKPTTEAKAGGINLSQYVMEEKDYFGFEESIIEKSSPVNNIKDEGESINLSEYLDKAYERFEPNYKIRFEDDES